MTKETIVIAFNNKLNANYANYEELMVNLNEQFISMIDQFNDAQIAYDELNLEIGDNLINNNFIYHLSNGGEPSIVVDELADGMLESLQEYWAIDDEKELECLLENNAYKTESNCGCDFRSAFHSIMEDLPKGYKWEDYIHLVIPEGEPQLEFFDSLEFLEDHLESME